MRIQFKIKPAYKKCLASILAGTITACASSHNPNDPYEAYNRKMFAVNMAVDHYTVRPVAIGYTYVPDPLRNIISNFYNNLRDFVTLGNDIMQLNGSDAMHNTMRIGLNSTFGILGMIDISSSMGLPQTKTSFGDTFKRWGWKNSSYIIIPLLGSSTFRDGLGLIPDTYFNPLFWITTDGWVSWSIFGINLINQRALALDREKLLMSSLDPYATIRDIYLQKNGEYIYPTAPGEKNGGSDDIDTLIDEANGISASPTVKPETPDIDTLIDEENQHLNRAESVSPR